MKNLIFLLFILFSIARNAVPQQSPCPGIFEYRDDGYEKFGSVQINLNDVGISSVFVLDVKLTARVLIPDGEPYGGITYAISEQETFNEISQKNMLSYKVVFPPRDNQPALTQLKLNNKVICTGKDLLLSNITRISLKHTIYYTSPLQPGQNPTTTLDFGPLESIPKQNDVRINVTPPSIKTSTSAITSSEPPPPPANTDTPLSRRVPPHAPSVVRELDEICGRTGPIIAPRIVNGEYVRKGDWPWIVAIFISEADSTSSYFQCGGTLITTKTVLTAAHCIHIPGRLFTEKEIVVVGGKHNIDSWSDGISNTVVKLELHSDFDEQLRTYDADIAILILKDAFVFTETLKPACLWNGDTSLSRIVDMSGVVVGWGKDENGKPFTSTPRRVYEKIVSKETCEGAAQIYKNITSRRTFCAGERNNKGPCSGDSGSGLVLNVDGRWFIRGIVSGGFDDVQRRTCDLTWYFIYTDVASFLPWINRKIVW